MMGSVTEASEVGESPVRIQREGAVSVIFLNRPDKGNAWSPEIGQAYFSALDSLAKDPNTKAIVVTGAGKNFCVGADPTVLGNIAAEGEHKPGENYHARPYYFPMLVGKPVIAAVNGACFGVGLQQVLCCDIRFVAEECKLSTAYARRGLVAELGMSWLLPRLVGTGRAMDWLLSARVVRAGEAVASGLANGSYPASVLLQETIGYARTLAEKCSPHSMREMKQQIARDLTSTLPAAYQRAQSLLDAAYSQPDFMEGITSWREGREPVFSPLSETQAYITLDPAQELS